MKTIITTSNSKLGMNIPSINMPTSVCGNGVPCAKGCYAKKGNFKFPKVAQGLQERLELFLNDSDKFFNTIIAELSGLVTYKYVRWHSSGDIVNMKYLYGIIKVAKALPQTNFLCFTKKFKLVNTYLALGKRLPKNLNIVFSGWDKDFIVDNPYNLPQTYVDFKKKSKNVDFPKGTYECGGKCETCQKCWHLKRGETLKFNEH